MHEFNSAHALRDDTLKSRCNPTMQLLASRKKYLEENDIRLMQHPPYLPEVALSDFWLFAFFQKLNPPLVGDHTCFRVPAML